MNIRYLSKSSEETKLLEEKIKILKGKEKQEYISDGIINIEGDYTASLLRDGNMNIIGLMPSNPDNYIHLQQGKNMEITDIILNKDVEKLVEFKIGNTLYRLILK